MADINLTIAIMTLNKNQLNIPFRDCQMDFKKFNYMLHMRYTLDLVTILIAIKTFFKTKLLPETETFYND